MPYLIDSRYDVRSLDILPIGDSEHYFIGDIRDRDTMMNALEGCDAVIHLACISNDPSFDLDPDLGKSINYDCFRPMVRMAKSAGVKRFIYASSSSVYGIKEDPDVTEDLSLQPLTDYSKYKALCEEILLEERAPGFETVIVRPATVCGYSPNLRLDLCVHILTMAAIRDKVINVFGGHQYRPNIHIIDMIRCYLELLEADTSKVDGEIFNCGYQNMTITETAGMIRRLIGNAVKINTTPSSDNRSYHVSSKKIKSRLGFECRYTVENAIAEIKLAYQIGLIPDPDDDRYHRIKSMKKVFS